MSFARRQCRTVTHKQRQSRPSKKTQKMTSEKSTKIANADITADYIRAHANTNTYGVKVWVCIASISWARKWAKMVNGGMSCAMGSGSATVWEIIPDMTSAQYEARRLAYYQSKASR